MALPPQVEGRSLGKQASNLAFLSAQRRDEAGFAQVTVRVGNFSDVPVAVEVRFTAVDDAAQAQQVKLPPSGTAVLRVGFKTSQPITVSLPDDALSEDGHLTLLPVAPGRRDRRACSKASTLPHSRRCTASSPWLPG